LPKLFVDHPLAILLTFLSFVLVSGAPIYCGWRVIDRRADKKPLATTVPDKVFGAVTLLLGIFYATLLAYNVGSTLRGIIPSWINGRFQPNWTGIIMWGLPLYSITATVVLGVTFCGASVCTTRPLTPQKWGSWNVFSNWDGRQTFMGFCSLLTSVVGSIMVLVDFLNTWSQR
jgi:hypothetical protein